MNPEGRRQKSFPPLRVFKGAFQDHYFSPRSHAITKRWKHRSDEITESWPVNRKSVSRRAPSRDPTKGEGGR